MRVAVCDADLKHRERLTQLLQEELTRLCATLRIDGYARGRDLVYAVQDGERFQAIFFDVEETTSLETVRTLRECGFDGELILTSSTSAFAMAGYDVGANGYLLKPYRTDPLSHLVENLGKYARIACLTIRYQNTWLRVPYHEIVFVESQNSKCILHRTNGDAHRIYCQLNDIEKQLQNDERFLRCHQSYLVNMDYIVKTDRQFELTSGDTVCIRQRDLRRIREQYLEYIERTTAKV